MRDGFPAPGHLLFHFQLLQVHQMDRKMDLVLKILTEQFPPQPQLTSQPSIRRVTIQKRKGISIDDGL